MLSPKQEHMNALASEHAVQQLMPEPKPGNSDNDQQNRCNGQEQDRFDENHGAVPASAFRSSFALRLMTLEPSPASVSVPLLLSG